MNKIILISIMVLASVFAVPMVLAGGGIVIPLIDAQAGPAGSASINGTFTVLNLETYNDARYTTDVLLLSFSGTAPKVDGTESYNPVEGTNISKEDNQIFSYNVGVSGEGWAVVQSMVMGHYYDNHTLGGTNGYYSATSPPSSPVTVDSTLPEFSSTIFPILLSMILFGIIRRKVK